MIVSVHRTRGTGRPTTRANALKLLQVSGAEQDLFKDGSIEGGFELLALETLLAGMPLQQADGETPDLRQVPGRVPLRDPIAVFAQRHVQLPVQVVLDTPVL